MGRVVAVLCAPPIPRCEVVAGFDVLGTGEPGLSRVSSPPPSSPGEADAVIDFSSPAALDGLLAFARSHQDPSGTGHHRLHPVSRWPRSTRPPWQVPIFRSANMSLGINVLLELVKKAASVLGDSYDIEIVGAPPPPQGGRPQRHCADDRRCCGKRTECHEPEYVYERHSVRQPRDKKEIGISRGSGRHHRRRCTRSCSPGRTRSLRSSTPP